MSRNKRTQPPAVPIQTPATHRVNRRAGGVAVLNASYEPHGKVSTDQAIRMLMRQVAVVEEGDETRRIGPHPWPAIIRLVRYVKRSWMDRPAGWSRRNVLLRDRHTCAYCGGHATTLDHVHPKSKGGMWRYDNVVSACSSCNERKGDRTPEEAGMKLRFQPWHPTRRDVETWRRREELALAA